MPKNKINPLPVDKIEQDFIEALSRLKEGKPTHKKLKAEMTAGTLKINIGNVAMEAGHSRTLIGMDACRYPKVREMIRQKKSGEIAIPTTYTELIKRLRADVAELKVRNQQYQDAATEYFLVLSKSLKQMEEKNGLIARLRQELSKSGKVFHIVNDVARTTGRTGK